MNGTNFLNYKMYEKPLYLRVRFDVDVHKVDERRVVGHTFNFAVPDEGSPCNFHLPLA